MQVRIILVLDYRELDDDAYYFGDHYNIHIYRKYTRYFNGGSILKAEEELHNMKHNLRKPRITPDHI